MKVALVYMNNESNVGRGVGYIAGSILNHDHDLTFFDTHYVSYDTISQRIVEGGFDVLLVSSMSMLFPEALRLIGKIKEVIEIPVLVGGIHATIEGADLLRRHVEIDYLCIGEGESMIAEFLDHFGTDRLHEVQNLAYRKNGDIVANPVRPAESLDSLPSFPWHLFDRRSIVQPNNGFMYVDATRGCPYKCTYCCNDVYLSLYGKSYLRHRPVEQVVEELKAQKVRFQPSLFYFGDEMILAKPDYARMLFTALHNEIGIQYGCMARVEHITEDIVDMLEETGCIYVAMGVECGDEEFRKKYLNRHMSNEKIKKAFDLVNGKNIFTTAFNMIGYPFDFDNRLTEATYQLNCEIKPGFSQISIFYPLPGTKLYAYCVENDLIDQDKLAKLGNYFSDSPLKGISLHNTMKSLFWRLNPYGFRSALLGYEAGSMSLRDRLERAAYAGNPAFRWIYRGAFEGARRLNEFRRKLMR